MFKQVPNILQRRSDVNSKVKIGKYLESGELCAPFLICFDHFEAMHFIVKLKKSYIEIIL